MDNKTGFSGGFEPLSKVSNDGIAASCGEGCHVESGSYICSSPSDASSAFEFSTVVIKRSESSQGRDLTAVCGAEFGDLSEETSGGDFPNTRNAGKDLAFGVPVVVGLVVRRVRRWNSTKAQLLTECSVRDAWNQPTSRA